MTCREESKAFVEGRIDPRQSARQGTLAEESNACSATMGERAMRVSGMPGLSLHSASVAFPEAPVEYSAICPRIESRIAS